MPCTAPSPPLARRQAAEKAGKGHRGACSTYRPRDRPPPGRGPQERYALPAKGVRQGVGFARDERFDQLRECIHAGAAVRRGGSVRREQWGSTTARRGSIWGCARLTLCRCRGGRNTALRVTSAPVPAVVGMAMHGQQGFSRARPASDDLQIISDRPHCCQSGDGFPASMTLPPPNARTMSQPPDARKSSPFSTRTCPARPQLQ